VVCEFYQKLGGSDAASFRDFLALFGPRERGRLRRASSTGETVLSDDPTPPALPRAPVTPLSQGEVSVPPELEVAIFKRFWIWIGSFSAFIIALGGLVWALSVSELKEYAKNVSENKAYAEWQSIRSDVSTEMGLLRNDLEKTTEAANKAVQDSRERVGEANEVTRTAHNIATEVEGDLKQAEASVKSAGDIFAAKTELEAAIKKAVSSPEFQTLFGQKIDEIQNDVQAKFDGLTKRVVNVEQTLGVLQNKMSTLDDSIGRGRVLGALVVKDGNVVYASTGVTFDAASGVVMFPNPRKLLFTPVVGGVADHDTYASNYTYVRSPKTSDNSFIVWRGALDVSGRSWPPINFTVAVIGFEP
jgi:hypothetical protein